MNAPADFSLRYDWGVEEIVAIHDQPLLDLVAQANAVHRRFHDVNDVQKAALLSIKTGGCPEDCSYCPQSAHHREVKLDRVDLMETTEVLGAARTAREAGADRFCMGAAWRSARLPALSAGPAPRPRASASTPCSTWCAACARSAWRPASRLA